METKKKTVELLIYHYLEGNHLSIWPIGLRFDETLNLASVQAVTSSTLRPSAISINVIPVPFSILKTAYNKENNIIIKRNLLNFCLKSNINKINSLYIPFL